MLPSKLSVFFSTLCVLTIASAWLIGLVGCHEVSGSPTPDEFDETHLDEAAVDEEGDEAGEPEVLEVPEGERRLQVGVDVHRAVGGKIEPGDRVDVLFTTTDVGGDDPEADDGGGVVTMSLLQNVLVLGVDDSRAGDGSVGVSLSLTPEEAEVVLLSQTRGQVEMILRADTDVDTVPVKRSTLHEVLEEVGEVYRERKDRLDDVERRDSAMFDDAVTLAERMSYGERAHTIVVSPFRADEARPKPGDRVDLTAVLDDEDLFETVFGEGSEHHRMSLDVLVGVEVLAVDEHPGDTDAEMLTVAVTPTEAEILITFEQLDALRAWLRAEGDRQAEAAEKWNLKELLEELDLIVEHRGALFEELEAGEVTGHLRGTRPLTLPADALDEQSLLPQPGSHVDIVGIFHQLSPEMFPGDRTDEALLVALVQNVAVLEQHDDTVTVAVTPQEAHLLELLPSSTTLNLTARNIEDRDHVPVMFRTFAEVMEALFVLSRPRCCRRPGSRGPAPCPPGQERTADGDCEPQIELIR